MSVLFRIDIGSCSEYGLDWPSTYLDMCHVVMEIIEAWCYASAQLEFLFNAHVSITYMHSWCIPSSSGSLGDVESTTYFLVLKSFNEPKSNISFCSSAADSPS